MKKLFGIAILGLAGVHTPAYSATPETKLVVGIVVDQLRTDYLRQLTPLFGSGGFNRLMTEGVVINDVNFRNTVSEPATGAAVIYTGAWPAYNGVAATDIYDDDLKRNIPVLASGASGNISPEGLRLSTIADEIAVSGNGLGRIYSIASDPQTAVIMSGHDGSGAFWIDRNTGKWTTSAFYSGAPQFLTNKARNASLPQKINGLSWKPLLPADSYPLFNNSRKPLDFFYTFQASNRNAYSNFLKSALYNEEATDLAIEILRQNNPAAPGFPTGMLNIEFTAAPIDFDDDGDSRLELMDTYVRLDTQMERLLNEIDNTVGLDNTLVFVISSGYADEPAINQPTSKIPGGEFSYRKAESLLDSYLSASYGNGDYVVNISGDKLYLNRKLIEEKRLNLSEVRSRARDFILKMSGISEVLTIDEVLRGDNKRVEDLIIAVDPKTTVDIFIRFNPGWTLIDDTKYPEIVDKARLSNPLTPAFILSPSWGPKVVEGSVEATAIAPTITSNLHIRAPNGAANKPAF